jgi:hypothetical protein
MGLMDDGAVVLPAVLGQFLEENMWRWFLDERVKGGCFILLIS